MDREQAKFLLDNFEVLKAFADSKPIEFRHKACDDWMESRQPSFSPQFEYRVKPNTVTVQSRRALCKDGYGNFRITAWSDGCNTPQHHWEVSDFFVKWIEDTQTHVFEI